MKADILIIGAGFAGTATAYHLVQRCGARILMVDMEEVPGFHASGRNASLVLQAVTHPEVRRIVSASCQAYCARAEQIGYRAIGSILLGSEQQLVERRDPAALDSKLLGSAEVRQRVPQLEGHQFDKGLLTPSDGVMDISNLLQFYLEGSREGDFELLLDCRIHSLEAVDGGFVAESSRGVIKTTTVVNAAGAWASEIAEMLHIPSLPMSSFKRHLFVLDKVGQLDENAPFIWSLARDFYFRPESGGLLFSICDEELSEGPFVQTVNPEISEQLAQLIAEELPALQDARQRQVWSCFRTKTPHGGFYLGWSAFQEGLFWVAGLGGHGMGASWEVGRLAAEAISSGGGPRI